jgi:chromosome segregation ATPase
MTPRRRSPKQSAATEPKNGTFANSVLLEDLRGQIKVIAEGLLDRPTRTELEVKFEHINEQFVHINDRFDANDKKLDARFDANETKLEARFDRIDERFDRNDERFDRIDQRFDANEAKFADFQNQIALLIDAAARQTREDIRSLRQDLANQSQASELRVLDRRVTVLEQQRVGG